MDRMRDKIAICLVLLAGFVTVARSGYILTFPWIMTANERSWACIHFQNLTEVSVEVTLKSPSKQLFNETKVYPNAKGDCFPIDVPSTKEKTASLSVKGEGLDQNSTILFEDSHDIRIKIENLIILVQPDKPIYKPGQTVKFRALLFNRHYEPWYGNIEKVYITDPKGTRIVQWLDHHVNGLLSLEMQLSDDPILGDWHIYIEANGQKQKKNVKVEEYVLPKYELTFKLPPYLSFISKTVDVEICAMYTYGKPVYGKLNGTICIIGIYEYKDKRPCFTFNEYITGCKKYSIESTALDLRNTLYSLWHVFLHVNATIIEEGTGITKTESNDELPIKLRNYKLRMDTYTKQYFKPGFAQYLNIIVTTPDEQPVPDLDMEVRIDDANGTLNNYVTDENGMISALIPAQSSKTKRLKVMAVPTSDKMKLDEMKADSNEHALYSTEEMFHLRQWFSPSNSFISIDPIYKKLPCADQTNIVFYYNYDETQGPTTIYYQVFSHGKNLVSDSTDHSRSTLHHVMFKESDLKAASLNGKNNSEVNDERSRDQETAEEMESSEESRPNYKQIITIPSQLGPDAAVIVYYIRLDNEIISDNIKIPVENCLPNPVSMKFNKNVAKPKNDVKLSVKAAANSLCAIAMVDKSVHILGGNNQITPEKVFERMTNFNLPPVGYEVKNNWGCDLMSYPVFVRPRGPPSGGPPSPIIIETQLIDKDDSTDNPQIQQNVEKKKKGTRKRKSKGKKKKKTKKDDTLSRQRRSMVLHNESPYADASEAFEETGLAVLTDLILVTKPCERDYFQRVYYEGMPGPMFLSYSVTGNENRVVGATLEETADSTETRSFFPETWLWDIEIVGPDGSFTLNKEVPDTITTWVGNAICANKEVGIGVSEQVNFNVFKPLFVSYTLPYSAVRGEKVPLIVSVFNYLTTCLTVKLNLVASNDFVVHQHPNKTSLCVCGEKPETVEYVIIPQELGEIDINVTAKATNKQNKCDPNVFKTKQRSEDNLSRKLLITAEGLPREYTYNSFFCLKADEDSVKVDTVRLELPKDHLVPDSHSASVSVIGDLMGPTLSGLENLVKMPYGCGEQNMVGFVPNIYVMQYLKNINKTDSPLIPSATKYMEKGYQRELQYQHTDGTFSAFGKSDKQGSTWLTAFVLKSFYQAKEFIYMDESILLNIIHWFSVTQMENGCFHEFGKVWSSYLKGGLESNGDIPLTAYSVIALLESGVPKQDMIKNAMECLSKAEVSDTYTLALMHYAFILAGNNDEKKNALKEELMRRVVRHDGNMYWTRDNKNIESGEVDPWIVYGQAPSAEVEITSYVLLGILQDEGVNAVAQTLPIIQWLTKQRNPYGGFTSTQDTVLALQALAEYAKYTYTDGLDMHISLSGVEFKMYFSLNNINSLILKTEKIKKLPNEIKLKANGAGCALVQMNVKYNIFETIANTSPLILKVFPLYDEKCDRAALRISVGDLSNSTNMAVTEIKLPTGWVVYRPSLKELEFSTNGLVKRAEVQSGDTQVNIYFEQLPIKEETFTFQVVQNIVLEETKPATSVLYYYYEKQIRTTQEFNLTTRCGKNKPASGHDKNENSTEEIQKRCPVCFDTVPENFMEIYCKSVATYKASLMNTPSKLKIYSNERPKPREIINSAVKIEIDSKCKCDNLEHKGSSTLTVLTTKHLYNAAAKIIQLNQWASIYPYSMIRDIRKEARKSPCKVIV